MSASSAPRTELLRHVLAGLGGLSGGVALLVEEPLDQAPAVLIPFVALVAAALVVHVPRLGPQLLARAAWWSNLGLGTILCLLGSSREGKIGLLFSLGCAFALLVVGRRSLAEATERASYVPAAFRGSLLVLMVLALADAQTFALFGVLSLEKLDHGSAAIVLLGATALLCVGFAGLLRLAMWGAIVNATTALALAVSAATEVVRIDDDFRPVVILLCAAQLMAVTPLVVFRLLGRSPSSPSPWLRQAGLLLALGVLVTLSVLGALDVIG